MSGNPRGRPREVQSWASIIREVTNATPEELAAQVGGNATELGRALAKLPRGVPLKTLVVARVVLAIMYEPSAGLLNALIGSEDMADIEERLTKLEGSRP